MHEGKKHISHMSDVSLLTQVRLFRDTLTSSGKVCTVRVSKGDDAMAACGMLGDPSQNTRAAPPTLPPPEGLRPQNRESLPLESQREADLSC